MMPTTLASTLVQLVAAQVFGLAGASSALPPRILATPVAAAPVAAAPGAVAPEVLLAQAPAPSNKKKAPAKKAINNAITREEAGAPPLPKKPAKKTPAKKPAQEITAAALTAKVQGFYEKTADFTAKFEQRYTYQVLGRSTKSAGTVAFKKGGLMRWDYVTPRKKAFIVDGDTLWVYTPEDHTVIKRPDFKPGSLSSSITFLWGEGDLAEEFDITLVAESTLRLVPKTAQSGFARLRFVVDPKTGQVLESTVIDAQGNTNHLVFSEAKLNTGIDAKRFEFKPPKGVSIQVLGDSGLQ